MHSGAREVKQLRPVPGPSSPQVSFRPFPCPAVHDHTLLFPSIPPPTSVHFFLRRPPTGASLHLAPPANVVPVPRMRLGARGHGVWSQALLFQDGRLEFPTYMSWAVLFLFFCRWGSLDLESSHVCSFRVCVCVCVYAWGCGGRRAPCKCGIPRPSKPRASVSEVGHTRPSSALITCRPSLRTLFPFLFPLLGEGLRKAPYFSLYGLEGGLAGVYIAGAFVSLPKRCFCVFSFCSAWHS